MLALITQIIGRIVTDYAAHYLERQVAPHNGTLLGQDVQWIVESALALLLAIAFYVLWRWFCCPLYHSNYRSHLQWRYCLLPGLVFAASELSGLIATQWPDAPLMWSLSAQWLLPILLALLQHIFWRRDMASVWWLVSAAFLWLGVAAVIVPDMPWLPVFAVQLIFQGIRQIGYGVLAFLWWRAIETMSITSNEYMTYHSSMEDAIPYRRTLDRAHLWLWMMLIRLSFAGFSLLIVWLRLPRDRWSSDWVDINDEWLGPHQGLVGLLLSTVVNVLAWMLFFLIAEWSPASNAIIEIISVTFAAALAGLWPAFGVAWDLPFWRVGLSFLFAVTTLILYLRWLYRQLQPLSWLPVANLVKE